MFQRAEIVEPDIGCQLKFQDDTVRFQCAEKLFPSLRLQVRSIQTMADPDAGHFLAGKKGFADALYAFFNVVPESVIFSRMDPDHKARVIRCYADQFGKDGLEIPDVIDLLPDDIAAGDIRISRRCTKRSQLIPQDLLGLDAVFDDRQRDPSEGCQEPQGNAGLCCDIRHRCMEERKDFWSICRLDQARIRDLSVDDPSLLTAPRDPKQLVLVQRIVRISRIQAIRLHLPQGIRDFPVRDLLCIRQRNLLL